MKDYYSQKLPIIEGVNVEKIKKYIIFWLKK